VNPGAVPEDGCIVSLNKKSNHIAKQKEPLIFMRVMICADPDHHPAWSGAVCGLVPLSIYYANEKQIAKTVHYGNPD